MKRSAKQLFLEFNSSCNSVRCEAREPAMDRVEYSAYPRVSRFQRETAAVSLDRSQSGLRIRSNAGEAVGTLLHVVVRDVDDQPTRDVLARVVWCSEVADYFQLGLAIVAEGRRSMRSVRPRKSADDSWQAEASA